MPVAVAKVLDLSCRDVCGMSADRCSNTGGIALLGIGGANPNADICYNRSTLLHRTEMHSYTNTTQTTNQRAQSELGLQCSIVSSFLWTWVNPQTPTAGTILALNFSVGNRNPNPVSNLDNLNTTRGSEPRY